MTAGPGEEACLGCNDSQRQYFHMQNHVAINENISKALSITSNVTHYARRSPSLGNTIKGKFSSPVIGVLKSGSDIKDIHKSEDYNLGNYTPRSENRSSFVSDRSNISESMEER